MFYIISDILKTILQKSKGISMTHSIDSLQTNLTPEELDDIEKHLDSQPVKMGRRAITIFPPIIEWGPGHNDGDDDTRQLATYNL